MIMRLRERKRERMTERDRDKKIETERDRKKKSIIKWKIEIYVESKR